MFTARNGVAIAQVPPKNPCDSPCQEAALLGAGNDYLVGTDDGGATWRTKGTVPERISSPRDAQLAFADPRTGYLLVYRAARVTLYLTVDGGRSWTPVGLPHIPTSVSIFGDQLWVLTNDCAYSSTLRVAPGTCPSRLLTVRAGTTTESSDQLVPAPPLPTTGTVSIAAMGAAIMGRFSAESGIVRSGAAEVGADVRLLLTDDEGLHWRSVSNPCESGIPITGIVEATGSRWVANCETGTREDQVAIYHSGDQGEDWSLVAESNPQGPTLGQVGDYAAGAIVSSADHHVLWRTGTAVGLDTSTDGGHTWRSTYVPTGYDTALVTAGARAAWLPAPYDGLRRTLDGVHWTVLR
jgi:hypothetical protein